MSEPGTPTLDQLSVFATVTDCGSFSAAARRLNRTQSVVSYTIARLEAQLGLKLFERDTRRPTLTDAGKAVLADSRRVGFVIDEMRARTRALSEGLEAEVSLAVDVMLPSSVLVDICRQFALEFPTVSLVLRVEALETLIRLVMDRSCVLGVSGPIRVLPDGMDRRQCGVVKLVTVAASSHPLSQAGDSLTAGMLREHTQLVLTDRESSTNAPGFPPFSIRTWQVSDLRLLNGLLCAGLGWAAMPEPIIADELRSGRLKHLLLSGPAEWPYPLDIIRRTDNPPRPATKWLVEKLSAALSAL